MRALAAVVALVVLPPSRGLAQGSAERTELTVLAGASLLDLQSESEASGIVERRSIGESVIVGIRAARLLGERARVGVRFAIAPSHELTSEFPLPCEAPVCPMPPPLSTQRASLVAYHYGIGGSFDLTRGRVRPFLGLGVGGVSYAASGEVDTNLAFTVEAGATVSFGRLGLHLEVADEIVPDHFLTRRTEHDFHVQAGVLIRLP